MAANRALEAGRTQAAVNAAVSAALVEAQRLQDIKDAAEQVARDLVKSNRLAAQAAALKI